MGNVAGHSAGSEPGAAEIVPLGDSAIVVRLGESIHPDTHRRVRQLADYLERYPFDGMIEYVPAFTTVTIYYDGWSLVNAHSEDGAGTKEPTPYDLAVSLVKRILLEMDDASAEPARIVDIPVCYGGEWGPDLESVAAYHGLTPEEVIEIHTSADYLVYMLGFAPGFAYLGGLSPRIATPRRQTPRLTIPAGTVGIAGDQTGVYPIDTPGGWQLIGRTPLPLFLPERMPPTLMKAGDIVRFHPISRSEFERWEERGR
jgi:inhibitor of KinA